ncbi:MAG: GAF domain-containing sensor histidine kinase [Actinocatenispora sp.]
MLDRVGDVMASRERLRSLLDAVVRIGTDLDLHSTLQRIVRSACDLVGARYGALGVIGPQRTLIDFITHGMSNTQRTRIGDLPRGHGVLGLLIDEPHGIRLPDIREHERAYGFPPDHPDMHTFLGVPIRIRDRVFGNLYLTEKEGGGEFTEDDEQIVSALSVAAGAAIDNARLYEQAGRRHRWLEATAEITSVLLGEGLEPKSALQLIADRALEVAEAELALVLLVNGGTHLTVEVASGERGMPLVGEEIAIEGSDFEALMGEQAGMLEDLAGAADWRVPVRTGPCLLVPLAARGRILGALVVAYPVDDGGGPSDPDVSLVETFAGQAALALERIEDQQQRDTLAILSDRERIARDLHDVVIQRLFVAGTQLAIADRITVKPEVHKRVNAVIDDLDATIRDIRGTIFELRAHARGEFRSEIRQLVAEAERQLDFGVRLTLDGPVETLVSEDIRPTALAMLREALSNVARHAQASVVRVTIRVDAGRLSIRVVDNGVGAGTPGQSGGLANMRRRAEERGGEFVIGAGPDGGTEVDWQVPL